MTDQRDQSDSDMTLGAEVGGLSFAGAVDALLTLHQSDRPIGTTGPVEHEPVLFRATPSMGFPAADVSAIASRPATEPPSWPVEMAVTFLGLYGPSSPMPAFWTEQIAQDRDGAENVRDFMDVFNHPLIALLYRIARHYRIHLQFDRALDGALPRAVMSLAGQYGGTAIARAVDWVRLLPFCGLLSHSARSTDTVQRIIAGYFDVPAVIEEWVRRMVAIPEDQMFTLGNPDAALGSGSVLGEAVPDAAGAVRIVLGPLSRADFTTFLPDGARRTELRALLTIVLKRPMVCFIDLVMRSDDVAGLVLGDGQLGWTTWQAGGDGPFRCETGPI